MEVHHHAHTARKKWTHYFWEFLMLFFAVFAGFLAENQREHYIENQRAKQLALNLYKEIFADSITVKSKIDIRNIKENECVYFIKYIKDSSLTELSPRFYPAFTWAFLQSAQLLFEPNDGILNQLRNSGELRYFKSNKLQTSVGKLSVAIANIRSRNEKEYSYIEFYLRPFSIKHYDFEWYERLTDHGRLTLLESLSNREKLPFTGRLMNADNFSRHDAENLASYYLLMLRGTRQTQYLPYAKTNHELLEILRKEYHIKD